MPNGDKSVVQKFLEDTNEESLFEKPESPLDVPLEQKEEEVVEVEKEEKPLPFHKDPKVQRYIEKEIAKRIPREDAPRQETQTEDEFKDVMDAFTVAIGNDTPEKVSALKALEKSLHTFDQRAVRRAEEKIEEIRQREREADKEAEEELQNAFEAIEENYDVDLTSNRSSKLRSEFVTFVEKIAPKDREGNVIDYPDMNSAWEIFSQTNKSKAQPNRAKELASRGLARSTETVQAQARRTDWNAVDEYIDSLK